MTFSYSANLADPISRIRQTLGDTVNGTSSGSAADVQDETITAYLSRGLGELQTAATLARDLAAKYAKLVTTSVDRQQIEYSNIYKNYRDLALTLQNQANLVQTPTGTAPVTANGAVGPIMVMGAPECNWSPRFTYLDAYLDPWCDPC